MKILITQTNNYTGKYVKENEVVTPDGFTIHGYPYVLSKHKNNKGHKCVLSFDSFVILS